MQLSLEEGVNLGQACFLRARAVEESSSAEVCQLPGSQTWAAAHGAGDDGLMEMLWPLCHVTSMTLPVLM